MPRSVRTLVRNGGYVARGVCAMKEGEEERVPKKEGENPINLQIVALATNSFSTRLKFDHNSLNTCPLEGGSSGMDYA